VTSTTKKGIVLALAVALGGALADASGPESSAGSSLPPIRLKTISSRSTSKGTSLVIEASEPVPYVATRPDPLTVFVDLRNVATNGLLNSVVASGKSPIAGVTIEPFDPNESIGAGSSRIRVKLAEAVAHRVRAERNTIVIDFDKPSKPAAPFVLPPGGHAIDPIGALGLDEASKRDRAGKGSAAAAQSRGSTTIQPTQAAPASNAPEAPQAGAGQDTQPGTPRNQRRFTGHPVSLDFQGADLRAVLRTFAEISGLNIVIDPAVQGSVDVALRDVPWDQALDIILRANKLGYIVDGTIVRIAPLTVLSDEESQRRKLTDEQALAGELRVLTKTLSYAKAEELQALLTKSALSQRGTVQVDPRTNTLIITDLAERLTTASDLIGTLDKPQPQVEIEARIVQTTKDYARALGIQWGFNGRVDPALGNSTNLAFPNSGTLSGRTGGQQGPTPSGNSQVPTGVNLGVTGASSAVGLALGSVNGALNLDFALSALERSGNGRLLSTPRVSTQNNIEAEITQGVQIPIQTVANNTVTVSFKDAALTLKVTPQITASNTVIMKISVENASPDFSRSIGGIPPINTQRALTSVLVSDGQTTVIGGIYTSQEQAATDRTPGLSRIPFLNWLFKRDTLNDQSTELLIFITPRILKS